VYGLYYTESRVDVYTFVQIIAFNLGIKKGLTPLFSFIKY